MDDQQTKELLAALKTIVDAVAVQLGGDKAPADVQTAVRKIRELAAAVQAGPRTPPSVSK